MEAYQNLINIVVSKYRAHGDTVTLQSPCIGKSSWTGNELADEIENQTEFGQRLVNNLVLLSLDLVTRGQEQIEVEKPITAHEFLISKGVLSIKEQKGIYEIQKWLTEFAKMNKTH